MKSSKHGSRFTMRVQVIIQIDVDPIEYNKEYGSNDTIAEIREAIKSEARSAAESTFNSRMIVVR